MGTLQEIGMLTNMAGIFLTATLSKDGFAHSFKILLPKHLPFARRLCPLSLKIPRVYQITSSADPTCQ
jgi:hypothetical protein